MNTANAYQISYHQLKEHRGQRRVWLQGGKLSAGGFEKGVRYSLTLDAGNMRLHLKSDPNGRYVVSGRKKPDGTYTPIIDLCSAEITDVFAHGDRFRVIVRQGEIQVDLHHEVRAQVERVKRLKDNVAEGFITEGVACAGIGVSAFAAHEGVKKAGLDSKLVWAAEMHQPYLDAAVQNNPAFTDTQLVVGTLEEIEADLLEPVNSLTFSLPCTGHSNQGKAKRGLKNAEEHPEAATSVFGIDKIIAAVNPCYITSENVISARESTTYTLLIAQLKRRGYEVFWKDMGGNEYGAVDNRRRWWLVAVDKHLAKDFDLEAYTPPARQFETLGDCLDDMPANDSRWFDSCLLAKRNDKNAAEGRNQKLIVADGSETKIPTTTRGYAKRQLSQVYIGGEGDNIRMLTPAEHARTKAVPELLVADLSLTTAHEGLGQGIIFTHGVACGYAVGVAAQKACGRTLPASAMLSQPVERPVAQPVATSQPIPAPAKPNPAEVQLTLL